MDASNTKSRRLLRPAKVDNLLIVRISRSVPGVSGNRDSYRDRSSLRKWTTILTAVLP